MASWIWLTLFQGTACLFSAKPLNYLNRCWLIVDWTLKNKLHWKMNKTRNIFYPMNIFENIVCQMSAISVGLNVLHIKITCSGEVLSSIMHHTYIPCSVSCTIHILFCFIHNTYILCSVFTIHIYSALYYTQYTLLCIIHNTYILFSVLYTAHIFSSVLYTIAICSAL